MNLHSWIEFRDDALGKKQDFKKTMRKANSHWLLLHSRYRIAEEHQLSNWFFISCSWTPRVRLYAWHCRSHIRISTTHLCMPQLSRWRRPCSLELWKVSGYTRILWRQRRDLVYGYDRSVRAERDWWNIYVLKAKPKVIIMGPPCAHILDPFPISIRSTRDLLKAMPSVLNLQYLLLRWLGFN